MARIYLTGSGQTRGYSTGSGIISLPPRVLIRQKDSATGSYPTIARTGDPDFTGKYPVFFDDTNTINFVSDNQTVYPVVLPNASKWLSNGVATPNVLQGIIATGSSKRGISDTQVSFTPGQNITPFDESRIYIDNNSSFYSTGTSTGTLPGFTQKLSSKTSISIDTNPSTATEFFFSTGTTPTASGYFEGVNTGIGYFNWSGKRWEIIGNLSTGSNIDILNSDESIRKNGLLAFVPGNLANFSGELIEDLSASNGRAILQAPGLPMSEYGFPFASRYDATGSQILDMSNYITSPFLLEKIVLEFSATFGPHIVHSLYHGPVVKTFFLMTQKPCSGSNSDFFTTITSGTNPGTEFGRSIQHGFYKSLLAFGMVSLVYSGVPIEYQRDLNVTVPGVGVRRTSVTGSYRLEFVPKVSQKNSFGGLDAFCPADRSSSSPARSIMKIEGGRSGFDISDGRSFVQGVGGLKPIGKHTFTAFKSVGTTTNLSVVANDPDTIATESPVVILPSDKLVLGFSNTPNFYSITQFGLEVGNDSVSRYEAGLAKENVVISPGKGKLTLYGSLLRNNLPVSPEVNQPLTSDAVHEALHYENPVFDQFDVEPYSALTGSYVDHIITGSMLVSLTGNPFAAGSRQVVGSVAGGQAGTTGSLQRFVRVLCPNQIYLDSISQNFTGSSGVLFQKIGNYGYTDSRNKQVSIKFRRDRYGQFRDLLDQSKESSYSETGLLRGASRAVEIKFFSRPGRDGSSGRPTSPELTHSQNLSPFSTSSLPYFDNTAVDRSDNPEISLADLPVISLVGA